MPHRIKSTDYLKIAIPVLILLVVVEIFFFAVKSINSVYETNRNNFEYTIQIRNTIEEIDKIVERAGVNLDVFADTISIVYDTKKQNDAAYNIEFVKRLDVVTKAVLMNSPGIDGSWFQINIDRPFATKAFNWYTLRNGKIVNYRDQLVKQGNIDRKLTPEDDPYYFEAVKNKGTTWSDLYTDPDSKVRMITISKPVYKNGVLIGVAGIDLSINDIRLAMKNMQSVFTGSEIFILDSNYKIILAQLIDENEVKNSTFPFIEQLKTKSTTKEAMVDYSENGVTKTAIMLSLSNKYNVIITFKNIQLYKGFNHLFYTVYFIIAILGGLAAIVVLGLDKIMKINMTLKNEKQQLRTIIDSSPNIILIKNTNGVYIDCNQKFLDFIGVTREDFIGKTDYDLFKAEDLEDIQRNDKQVLETGEMVVQTSAYSNKDGVKIFMEKYLVPLRTADQEIVGILINAYDVTKREQEQEILQHAKEMAEKANIMKSNFVANMSHEIRTPLNGVLGFIQLLKDTNTTDEQEEFINDAEKSSELLLDIINDILDFSKIEADKLQIDSDSFDIRSVVEDVTLMATANAEAKGVDVNSLICSDVPQKIIGDAGRVKQVLNNLVGNAIKFTPKGEVIIYAKLVSEDADKVVLNFEVKDTGIGIEEDKLKLIFEAFTQADGSMTRRFGGTGLGLAISRKLVGLMNGEMKVESTVGEGSTFSVQLPFKKDTSSNIEQNTAVKSLDGTKILVVNNNTTDLKIIKYYLNEANCIILEAQTTQDSIEILNQENQNVSAILIDYDLQTQNEQELSTIIKENEASKDIPMILYTSLSKRGDAALAKEKGFSGYLTKPIKKYELVETLSMAINNQRETTQKQFITKHLIKEQKFSEKSKILVVEDSEINCKLILKILSNNGLACDLALNGKEAVEAYKSNKYDLILMDCQMPVLDGYEATKEIRRIEAGETHIPIVALTANALATDEDRCHKAGMDDYISKPINIEALLTLIGKYIKVEAATSETEEVVMGNQNGIEDIINSMTSELELSKVEAIEFFTEYMEFLPEAIEELETAIGQNDFEELKKIAHKLKGSSANLRIEILTQLSLELEEQASKGDNKACVELLTEIKQHIEYLNSVFLKFIHS